jgi:hypothetical protein
MLSHALARPLSNPTFLLSLFSAPQLAPCATAADHVSCSDFLSLLAAAAIIIVRSREQSDSQTPLPYVDNVNSDGRVDNRPLNASSSQCPDSTRVPNTPKRGSPPWRAVYAPISLRRKNFVKSHPRDQHEQHTFRSLPEYASR